MKRIVTTTLVLALAVTVAGPASSHTRKHRSHVTYITAPRMTTTAWTSTAPVTAVPRISLSDARATAMADVSGGQLRSEALVQERGRLVYVFDIREPGRNGFERILVDARSGRIIDRDHEAWIGELRTERERDRDVSYRMPMRPYR